MRRCRERRAKGTIRVNFDISADGTAVLADLGWLHPTDRRRRAAVKDALTRFVNAAAANRFSAWSDPRWPDR
jgi:hypothetical protein